MASFFLSVSEQMNFSTIGKQTFFLTEAQNKPRSRNGLHQPADAHTYLDHLDRSGLLKEAGELGAVDAERQVADEQPQILGELLPVACPSGYPESSSDATTAATRTDTCGLQLDIKALRCCGGYDGREAAADGVGLAERERNWGEEVEKSVSAIGDFGIWIGEAWVRR
jgi:hypothetical protein